MGTLPLGKLVQSGSKLYAATAVDAANGRGALFEYDPVSNILTKKYDFPQANDATVGGQHTLTLLNGKFYGLSEFESGNNGHIFEWDPNSNIYTVKKIFDGINDRSNSACYLTLSGNKFYRIFLFGNK